MKSIDFPEIRLAKRLIEKHQLTPPIDIQALLESYATVYFKTIPIPNVDGLAINIKVPNKNPVVIINKNIPTTRQNFTMAHELGHLIIPWHTGIKIDDKDSESIYSEISYSIIEQEANRFAASLLMPTDYIEEAIKKCQNLADSHKLICKQLSVSPIAAAKRVVSSLPPGVMYCAVRSGAIEYSGRSEDTSGQVGNVGDNYSDGYSPFEGEHSHWISGSSTIHWWRKSKVILPDLVMKLIEHDDDQRTWSMILDTIVDEINPYIGSVAYKKSLSGAIGSLNGKLLFKGIHNLEDLIIACYERLTIDPYKELSNHRNFGLFLVKKCKSIFERNRNRF